MNIVNIKSKKYVKEISKIHVLTFKGFFLTFLGEEFLSYLYRGFIEHDASGILGAFSDEGELIGFLAYSSDISSFYRYLLKKYIIRFIYYSLLAVLRKPKILFRLIRALTYPEASSRKVAYMELASIGVLPSQNNRNVGTSLIDELKKIAATRHVAYIKLETDRLNNSNVNAFYLKNGFVCHHSYITHEGRSMNEYRFNLH